MGFFLFFTQLALSLQKVLFMVDKSIEQLEERVKEIMKQHAEEPGFPKLSDYDIDEDELNDYFFDQKIIDDPMEKAKKTYTLYGLILIMPVVVFSMFPGDEKYLFISLGIGAVLCLMYYLFQTWRRKQEERKLRESGAARFVDAVLKFTNP